MLLCCGDGFISNDWLAAEQAWSVVINFGRCVFVCNLRLFHDAVTSADYTTSTVECFMSNEVLVRHVEWSGYDLICGTVSVFAWRIWGTPQAGLSVPGPRCVLITLNMSQMCYRLRCKLDVCLSVHRCICVEKKNHLDATEWCIALTICSTCFGHFYAHHQELETICVLLPPMVCSAWLLIVGGQVPGSRLCVQEEGCCTTAVVQLPSSWILHAIGVNNKHIVSSSWWWSLCCPKYVEHILSAINHSMASSWFFFSTHNQRCTDKHTSSIYVTINENVTLNVNITLHVPTNCTSRNFSSPPPQTHTHTVLIYII